MYVVSVGFVTLCVYMCVGVGVVLLCVYVHLCIFYCLCMCYVTVCVCVCVCVCVFVCVRARVCVCERVVIVNCQGSYGDEYYVSQDEALDKYAYSFKQQQNQSLCSVCAGLGGKKGSCKEDTADVFFMCAGLGRKKHSKNVQT